MWETGGREKLLVALGDEAWPVTDGVAHISAEDEVKWLGVGPFGFYVVDFEAHIRWHPSNLVSISPHLRSWRLAHHRGWIGLKSFPRIVGHCQYSARNG
jgi:hypothetical protein